MVSEQAWEKIFEDYKIKEHDFKNSPFELTAEQIKRSCQNFRRNVDKEPRILCKQDTRNSRPQITNCIFYLRRMEYTTLLKVKDILIFQILKLRFKHTIKNLILN